MDQSEEISVDNTSSRVVRQKIVFVGDVAVGKTSIINRFNDNIYNDTYDVTILSYTSLQ